MKLSNSKTGSESNKQPTIMWSDNESNIDLLRFNYISEEVAQVVTTPELLPVTVGIFGNWGSGKSTLIKMVQKTLADKPGVMALEFNGWLFEGYEDAKTALMGSILDGIEDRIKKDANLFKKGSNLLKKLLKRVKWLQAMGLAFRYAAPVVAGLPQLSVANLALDVPKLVSKAAGEEKITADDVKDLIAEAPEEDTEEDENIRRNIRDFRRDFASLLSETKITTLVVFIDDLDRCLPDTIIETLEAIKLFLFVPGTAFIIGADERLVQYAVRQRFPELPGTETEVGRDYLEKLIQVPIRVPALSSSDIESYMNLLFAERRLESNVYKEVCEAISTFQADSVTSQAFDFSRAKTLLSEDSISEQLQEDFDLTAQIVPVLTAGLGGNPRRAKRFLNTLLLRLSLGSRRGLRLERRVLAKLMLLEYIRSEFFLTLANLQALENGRPRVITLAEQALKATTPTEPVETEEQLSEGSLTQDEFQKVGRTVKRSTNAKKEQRSISSSNKLPEENLPTEIQPWFADAWMRTWLVSEPPLSEIDLTAYFFIAHDKIGASGGIELRLSPAATEVLNRLLSPNEVTQKLGLNRTAELNQADAGAVFQQLAQRIRQAEILDDKSVQGILFKLMEMRQELLPQFISLYGSLPETKITLATPSTLVRVTKDTSSMEAARSLVDRWTRSTKPNLAKAAQSALRRM